MDSESASEGQALVPTDHKVITVEGGELEGCEIGGVWYVAIARACRRLRLNWSSQHKRLLRDPILSKGMVIMTIPSVGGDQETICLRLDLFWGWLFKLDLSRLEPDIAEQIMPLQLVGYQALYERFSGTSVDSAVSPLIELVTALADQVTTLANDVAQLKEQGGTGEQKRLPVVQRPGQARPGARQERRQVSLGAELLATRLEAIPHSDTLTQVEMAQLMRVDPRTIGRWLQELKEAGIVTYKRQGRRSHYIVEKQPTA